MLLRIRLTVVKTVFLSGNRIWKGSKMSMLACVCNAMFVYLSSLVGGVGWRPLAWPSMW